MKKFFVVMLAVMISFAVMGCGGNSGGNSNGTKTRNINLVLVPTGTVSAKISSANIDGGGCKQAYNAGEVAKIGVGPSEDSLLQSSDGYLATEFSRGVTEASIDGIKVDAVTGKVRFIPFLVLKNKTILWFNLSLWTVNGSNLAIVDDGKGSKIIEIQVVLNGNSATSTVNLPIKPTGITATPSDAKVILAWNQNMTNTVGYITFIALGPNAQATTGLVSQVENQSGGSYSFTNLINGTEYFFWVKAYNSFGQSESSVSVSATPNSATAANNMSTPAGLVGSNNNGVVNLSWNMVSGAYGYQVNIRTASNGAIWRKDNAGNNNAYQVNNLTIGTTYYFSIQAYDNSNPMKFSNESNQIAILAAAGSTSTLPAPASLTGNGSNGMANLNWTGVSNAYGYTVYWKTDSNGQHLTSKNIGNFTSAQLNGFTIGQTIYFVVRAYDVGGILSPQSNEVAIYISNLPTITFDAVSGTNKTHIHVPASAINSAYFMSAPPIGAGSQVCANSSIVGWAQASTACVGYSSGPTEFIIYNVMTNNGRFTGNISLRDAQTVVYAKLNDGTKNLWATSPAGGIVQDNNNGYHIDLVVTGNNVLVPPTNFTASSSGGNVALNWSAPPTPAIGVVVYIGDQSGVEYRHVDVGTVTSYTVTGLGAGNRKYFWLKSYDCCANMSAPSNEITLVVQ